MKAKFKNPNFRKLSKVQRQVANSKKNKSEFDHYVSMVLQKENIPEKTTQDQAKKTKMLLASIGVGIVLAASLTTVGIVVSGSTPSTAGTNNTLSTYDAGNQSQMIFVERKEGTARYKIKFTQTYNDNPIVSTKEMDVSGVASSLAVGNKKYDSISYGTASLPLKIEVWAYDNKNNKLGYLSKIIGQDNQKNQKAQKESELLNF